MQIEEKSYIIAIIFNSLGTSHMFLILNKYMQQAKHIVEIVQPFYL